MSPVALSGPRSTTFTRSCCAALAFAVLAVVCPTAQAYWPATDGQGTGAANVSTLDPAVISAPSPSPGSVTLTWTAQAQVRADASAGPVTYVVERALGTGAYAPISSGPCSGSLTRPTSTCTDTVPASGTYAYRVVASMASWTATSSPVSVTVSDATAPTASLTRADTSPSNAASVRWTVSFSEAVTGVNAGDFALASTGAVAGAAITGVTGSGTTWTVTAATGSGDGGLGLNLVDDDSVKDAAGNPLGGAGTGNGAVTGPVYTLDRTAPALTKLELLDTSLNGKVDQVKATFDEALASSTLKTNWTLSGVPSGGTLSSVTVSGTAATLTLTEGAGSADTAPGSMTVALAAASTGIRDALGNQASFAATAPADKAQPVLLSVTDTNGLVDGLMQTADTLTLGFSEPLKSSTVPTAPTITEARPASGNATLSIPGVTSGALGMGSAGYLLTAGASATFAGTTTTSGSTIKVTVGACASGCTAPTSPVTTPTMSFTASTGLTDAAGNTATKAYSWTAKAF